jgi:hypothetical protein
MSFHHHQPIDPTHKDPVCVNCLKPWPCVVASAAIEIAAAIREDMEAQGAGGQYDMGMKRAIHLTLRRS